MEPITLSLLGKLNGYMPKSLQIFEPHLEIPISQLPIFGLEI